MYTADQARQHSHNDLDCRIERAVKESFDGRGAYMRFYAQDWFSHTLHQELEKRGFINIAVPDFVIKGDVYFEWVGTED